MFTADIIDALINLDDSPWAELGGAKGITDRWLARHLREYEIRPGTVRCGDQTAKGYKRENLHDAWSRYIDNYLLTHSPARGAEEAIQDSTGSPSRKSVTTVTAGTTEVTDPTPSDTTDTCDGTSDVTTGQCPDCGEPTGELLHAINCEGFTD
jgi:hypothetical protein